MPRITRKQQKVFAVNATNNGVFGSLQANDPVYSQDPDAIQGRTAYSNGWNDATYSAEKLPPLEEFQALQYLFSRQLAYLMQDGISEWDTNTTYYKGSLVKAIQSDGSFILYASLVDNNQGNLVTDTTKWTITNTSTNFHQGIPNWRADVIYSEGDWVKSYSSSTGWSIYESTANSNLNNAVTDIDYWAIKPFTSEFPLLMCSWFDHEVDDMSWLRADTFSWQDGTVYERAYQHLVDDIDGKTTQTETIGTYTISYYLADDGHKITTDETTVANIYTESGVAWYYVLDTINQRFKLPRENPNREFLWQTAPVVGDGGYFKVTVPDGSNLSVYSKASGYYITNSLSAGANVTASEGYVKIPFSNSGMISKLKESSGVFKGKKYLYFYVGNFSQSAIEQTAGLNAELFNDKLDLDAGNLSNTGKSFISSLGLPSHTYDDLTLGASDASYQAPANGWFVLNKEATGSGEYINMRNYSNGIQFGINSSGAYQQLCAVLPCLKGDSVLVGYNAAGTIHVFRFVYAEGENNV